MLKRGMLIVGILALLGGLCGCAGNGPIVRDGPGVVNIPRADMALFGTWANEEETVRLVIEGDLPYLTLLVNGEKTFEAPASVDTENGNVLLFSRDDGEIIPVPYAHFRIDLEGDLIYGTRAGEDDEELFRRVNEDA